MRLAHAAAMALMASLASSGVSAAAAQRAEQVPSAATAASSVGVAGMVAGGLAGAVAGMYAGIAIGDRVDRARGYDGRACPTCTRWGAGLGASLGTTLGVVVGVHLANRGRGRFPTVLLRTSTTMLPFWAASYLGHRLGAEGLDALAVLAGVGTGLAVAARTERRTMPGPQAVAGVPAAEGTARTTP